MVKNSWFTGISFMGAVAICLLTVSAFAGPAPRTPMLTILYPKHNAEVGKRVNLVLDPATDWSTIPFFRVSVGATEYPVVDTSSGRHAFQGLLLQPGVNMITVKALAPLSTGPETAEGRAQDPQTQRYRVLVSQSITVYNREGVFSAVPAIYAPQFFHTRGHEADCSGCHRLETGPQDFNAAKPQDVLCFSCHRNIPSGKYIHGPAAVWNCLGCHNPELYPAKYQFTSADPWKVSKSTYPVEPVVFTISADSLFSPQSAVLLSSTVPAVPADKKRSKAKTQELVKARNAEIKKLKDREREFFKAFLEYMKQNPTDRVRVEAHTDTAPLPKEKDKKARKIKSPQQLTVERAKAVAALLKTYGITGKNRMITAGMGSTLPKAPNTTKENRDLNNRIELVAHPPDVKVQNSLKLPQLKDRERVVITVSYSKGAAAVRGLRVVDRLPRGMQYAKGSGIARGRVKDPQVKGEELSWALGDPGTDFQETVIYVVRKDKGAKGTVNPVTRLRFAAGAKEETRDFDPAKPFKSGLTVRDTCEKCHQGVLSGTIKHGPAGAGACDLCHDPHGSNYPAWTRKQSWRLCTTCHAEKAKDVHVIAGFVYGMSHPTRKWPDPSRPGKRIVCVSCHSPHSGETDALLAYGLKSKFELCALCHKKK